jgi:MoaA/NifB/PqqE/SkfB family radical SAM enzyme
MTSVNKFNASEKILKYVKEMDYFFNSHKTLISVELDLTNLCNNRCPRCTGIKDKNVSLTFVQVRKLVDELADVFNAKSIIISGGGEPLLNKDFVKMLYYIKSKGIDIGLNSNGYSLNAKNARAIADCCAYFRISLDAGTPEMYKKTHGVGMEAFEKVLGNIRMFDRIRKEAGSSVSFGTGYLTGRQTKGGILDFFKTSKACGVDFAQLRPFTNDLTSVDRELKEAGKLEDRNFKVASSDHKYSRFADDNKRPYKKCWGMFFNTVVTADFRVFACLHHRQNGKYLLGDLNKSSLYDIWHSARMRDVFERIDFSGCPYFCRNDEINRSLELVSRPVNHVKFL